MALGQMIRLVLASSIVVIVARGQRSDFQDLFLTMENDSECTSRCSFIDDLGPPPDMILSMPPPPIPPFMQHLIMENTTLNQDNDGNCNFCHLFAERGIDSEFTLPNPKVPSTKSWSTLAVTGAVTFLIIGLILTVLLIKCRRGKLGRMSDLCPTLAGNFLRGQKSPPPACSPADSCISPVVNEKSPQSIITSAPNKKSTITTKYWRRADFAGDLSDRHRQNSRNFADGGSELEENYACADGGSCTSSPVYAELDGCVTHIPQGQLLGTHVGGPILISGPAGQSASPYSVGMHTYSEVAEAVRMAALGSSTALLPDASYDNAAYLPTSTNNQIDLYNTRSLRRGHRAATLAQLGSATPLLTTTTSHLGGGVGPSTGVYLTGGRPSKKPRPPFSHQLARGSLQRMQEELERSGQNRAGSYVRGAHGIYTDLPVTIRQSPSLTTFKSSSSSPYAYRSENPKRPLPPVPGVRL